MSKRNIFIVAGCLLLVIGWWTCHRSGVSDPPDQAGSGARNGGLGGGAVPVIAGKVEQKDVPIYLDGLGTVQAFNTVTIHSRVDGELQKVLFKEGQDVTTGDLLAQIDPRPFQEALDQAVGKKGQDAAQLANAQATLARNTDLLKKQVIDRQDFDTSEAQAGQFQAAVQADQAAIESAQTQLDYTQIKSPIDGRTGIRLVDIGNIVHATDTTGIVVITQLRPISVVFTLPEQDLQEVLNEGGAGAVSCPALDRGNHSACGEERSLWLITDRSNGPAVRIKDFPNEDLKLWPGKFVNARLVLTTKKNATVVPASVVQRGPQGTYAYVIKQDKTVEMRTVKVGQTESGQTLVDSGLKPGEQVVVDGQYKLQPGLHVELTSPSGQRKPAAAQGDLPRPSHASPPSREHFRAILRRPVATSLADGRCHLLGLLGYKLLPISALPTVDFPTIQVTTLYPGASECGRDGVVDHDALEGNSARSAASPR
jgi:multidrug efflux system membrane fusion protein